MNFQKQLSRGVLLCNFIETALRHGCSPVNLLHIFRTPFPKNTSGWLLLKLDIFFSGKQQGSIRTDLKISYPLPFLHGGNDFQSSYITFDIFNNWTFFGTSVLATTLTLIELITNNRRCFSARFFWHFISFNPNCLKRRFSFNIDVRAFIHFNAVNNTFLKFLVKDLCCISH